MNRANGSGTRATFEKWGLDGATPIQSQEQDSSGTVRQLVSQTPGAISYLAFSYLDDSTQALSIDGVEPKEENVADNSWKIWSYEHMYTNGKPSLKSKILRLHDDRRNPRRTCQRIGLFTNHNDESRT